MFDSDENGNDLSILNKPRTPKKAGSEKRAWWKAASVYQIYPASFKDSNGDGWGDIPGIISKLDYIKDLGVDVVWLCPIYPSPQVDMGYDISDYKNIDPHYGTLEDLDKLIEGLHARGMKLVMDLVVNHTSDQHVWFQESKKGKDNPYRDWYIWRKPKYDDQGKRQPPNNWGAIWGGSAWVYDEASDEYYLHIFAPEQPDLNWENPKVRAAVLDIMTFWLERKVSGFRMDVINFISKEPGLPDADIVNPNDEFQPGFKHYACGPRLHEYLQELGQVLLKYNAFSVGEMPCVSDPKEIIKAVGFDRKELNMIFHFDLMNMDSGSDGRFSPRQWRLDEMKQVITKYQYFMLDNDGWNALYLENHDQSRTVSRFGSDLPEHRVACAKSLATTLALQAGTVFVYQGQELGMINIPKTRDISEYRDLETLNRWEYVKEKYADDKAYQKMTLEEIQKKSRDNARTPMQWDTTEHAGFSTSTPWQKVNESYTEINAAAQLSDKNSVFRYWSNLLKLRKQHEDFLVYGDFEPVDNDNTSILAFKRIYNGKAVLVASNLMAHEAVLTPDAKIDAQNAWLANLGAIQINDDGKIKMRPFEAFVCPYVSTEASTGQAGSVQETIKSTLDSVVKKISNTIIG